MTETLLELYSFLATNRSVIDSEVIPTTEFFLS